MCVSSLHGRIWSRRPSCRITPWATTWRRWAWLSRGAAARPLNPWLRSSRRGVFVGLHGSWNRKPRSGYKVVFVPFRNGKPDGMPLDVLTGFVSGDGDAWGRPVGVALDGRGGLLVADDVGNTLWRVAAARP